MSNVHNAVKVKWHQTKGDGNCFFHAVFGDKDSPNPYETKHADTMRKEWHNFLSQFNSLQDPKMPNKLKDQLKTIFTAFINNPEYLTNRSEQIKELADQTRERSDNAGTDVQSQQSIVNSFCENENLYQYYLGAISSNNYYVFTEEIPILASLANIKITFYRKDNHGKIYSLVYPLDKELLGQYQANLELWGTKEEAIIFHEGMHFSHAEYYTSNIQNQQYAPTREYFNANEEAMQKFHVKELSSKLFGVEISKEIFADIVINDKDGNHHVTVCRSKIIGSSIEQMHYVTPLLFLKQALGIKVLDVSIGKNYTVDNFIKYILAISDQIQGRCLTQEQYDSQKLNRQEDFFNIKVITTKRDSTKKIKYLITNEDLIEQLESHEINLSEYNVDESKRDYTTEFQRYIKYVLSGFQKMILDDYYILETTCELIAKFILTTLSQQEGVYFSTKDNMLFKEIRLYQHMKGAKLDDTVPYEVVSHKEIVDRIEGNKFKYQGNKKEPHIRIIDVKEQIVQNTVEALDIIDSLIKGIVLNVSSIESDKISLLLNKYNKYNFKINTFTYKDNSLDNYTDYEDPLTENNCNQIFHCHAAKHLYLIFNFRSLGTEKMFAPKQKGDRTGIVKVYTSNSEQLSEQYSIQKSATAIPAKEPLTQQVISHISLMLAPFSSLNSNVTLEEDVNQQGLSPIKQIFNSFCKLLKADYSSPNILDQVWYNDLERQFNIELIDKLDENLSVSGDTYRQDNLDFS
ncbi:hypothetical protein [Candidatus Tisiphia endosymbiont of Oplodontha viridula]|uniref:hypothetical protein n=1 Tax=Candidatus Tisiphia endosymbiont of Oplodontha viridula TaxID=3077925 RepID=UPI0035C90449